MTELPDIKKWQMPIWHPDFGNPTQEFDDLCRLAEALVSKKIVDSVTLESPEAGLMYLQVMTTAGRPVEVHSVSGRGQDGQRRFGIFVSPDTPDEIESYADSVADAVALFDTHTA